MPSMQERWSITSQAELKNNYSGTSASGPLIERCFYWPTVAHGLVQEKRRICIFRNTERERAAHFASNDPFVLTHMPQSVK
jgi:hypothetical protein